MHAETGTGAEPSRRSLRDTVDLAVALCAFATSIASIWLSLSQADDMQRLVQAQSWPFLGMNSSNTWSNPATGKREDAISLEVQNLGVGPAKIKWLRLWYRGKPINSSGQLLAACCLGDAGGLADGDWRGTPLVTSNVSNRVLRAGQSVTLLSWARPPGDDGVWKRLDKARFEIEREICYCSVFDECWTSRLDSTDATPVAECPVVEQPYRE